MIGSRFVIFRESVRRIRIERRGRRANRLIRRETARVATVLAAFKAANVAAVGARRKAPLLVVEIVQRRRHSHARARARIPIPRFRYFVLRAIRPTISAVSL